MNEIFKNGDSMKPALFRFGLTLLAPLLIGIVSAAMTGWIMVQVLDNRVTVLEAKVEVNEPLKQKVDKLEVTIDRHEKALDRDFLRHEQIVAGLTVKTEDQEKRLTRMETLYGEMQSTLIEIRTDIKRLLSTGVKN